MDRFGCEAKFRQFAFGNLINQVQKALRLLPAQIVVMVAKTTVEESEERKEAGAGKILRV